jgi:hypothetical protein
VGRVLLPVFGVVGRVEAPPPAALGLAAGAKGEGAGAAPSPACVSFGPLGRVEAAGAAVGPGPGAL